jgi:hypothetical protein
MKVPRPYLNLLLILCLPLLLLATSGKAETTPDNTIELLEIMKVHLQKTKVKEYTFIQETIRFQENGSPKDTLIWHEAMQFPNRFRIDFGDLRKGNSVIYSRDSVFHIRGKLVKHSGAEVQEFMLLEGGLKEFSAEATLGRLKEAGYDTGAFRADEFDGHKVWVIGGAKGDLVSKQVWIDQEKLTTRRRIDPGREGKVTEAIFDEFECKKRLMD